MDTEDFPCNSGSKWNILAQYFEVRRTDQSTILLEMCLSFKAYWSRDAPAV